MKKRILSTINILVIGLLFLITSHVSASAPVETKRLWGADRYQTCSEIVNEGWQTSEYAVLVNGENFPDALSASTLAKKYNAPILLTQDNTLDNSTKYQLKRLNVKKVFIVGGSFVIKSAVEDELHNMNIETQRFSGQDRTETSIAVAKEIGSSNGIILTTDNDYTDALSVAPVAAKLQIPIILMPKDSVPASVSGFIAGKSIPKVYVLGDSDLINDSVVSKFSNIHRIPGKDKYERNINIMNDFADNFDFSNACLAYSEKFADALSGSAYASISGNPIILVGDTPSAATKNFVSDKKLSKLKVLGGTAGITQTTLDNLLGTATSTNQAGQLKVHFIDVGQGDSILIQTPNGKNMLIDAGTNESTNKLISYLQNLGITQLDIIAGTHPHEDHIGGMDAVINMFKVGKIYMPKVTTTTKTFEDVLNVIKNKGLSITTPVAGSLVDLDPAVKLQIVAPIKDKYDDLNNYSIVFKLTYGSKSFLFTGDAEEESENEMLLSSAVQLKADVLKVGHHGSNSSTSDAFLKLVEPQYAVISVGKGNDYGHPTQATLDKLKNAGVTVYRTDESGTIIATCDGSSINFNVSPGSYDGPRSSSNSNSTNGSSSSTPTNNTSQQSVTPSTPAVQTTDNQSSTVYVTKTGKKYHKDGCSSLRKSKIPMSLQDAKNAGYVPCEICNPPQ